MDLGFETIGNACVILHDRGPLLATDTWIDGPAYFGSWSLSHEFPAEQRANVAACKYVWISHGHPDHLSLESLEKQRDKEILLPDHYGGRIRTELEKLGFNVSVLPSGKWVQLSERVRVCSVADVYQDAVLLADMDGQLVADTNDCGDHGGGDFLRSVARRYERSFLACLAGYGDADMIHFFDEDGRPIAPQAAAHRPFASGILGLLDFYGIRTYAPSSTMHKYQRADSCWANSCATPIEDFEKGYAEAERARVLPAFVQYDLIRHEYKRIAPRPEPDRALPPEQFGDRWSDPLEAADVERLAAYFAPFEHLKSFLGYVRFKVGGREHVIDIAREHFARGITFECPRQSLMSAVEWQIFDDLLIGNFAKTTLHGAWPARDAAGMYPDFTPFVAKFGDNGGARSKEELARYFRAYRAKGFFGPSPAPGAADLWAAAQRYMG